ncbi:ATP-binding cassette domain-containing protein [Deferribacter autotrophicus]|uniref:ATP-binding cassette domain-containing protein n=1 Tax=Deferribacter autotrophicus TaxID=500465 RepID=A0A5A8F4Z5_9BACT|nr:ABC transporter ATP-binding protein [Deferribacter autotrophicus]KAA0258444.1 ATP-binding cassette domain-containing protein [Deferribacter autotrophicus]
MKSPLFLFLNNLTFSYKNKRIFSNFNFQAEFDNILLVKGDVGSGKSTLLKLIYGYYQPESGKVSLSCENNKTILKKYFIHSNSSFNFVTGFIKDEMNLLGVVDVQMNLDLDLSKHISEYSGGELKKIAVNMALALDSNVIIMDEPFEMLDDNEVIKVKDAILDAVSKYSDKFFIIATHEDLLDEYADEILYLK